MALQEKLHLPDAVVPLPSFVAAQAKQQVISKSRFQPCGRYPGDVRSRQVFIPDPSKEVREVLWPCVGHSPVHLVYLCLLVAVRAIRAEV